MSWHSMRISSRRKSKNWWKSKTLRKGCIYWSRKRIRKFSKSGWKVYPTVTILSTSLSNFLATNSLDRPMLYPSNIGHLSAKRPIERSSLLKFQVTLKSWSLTRHPKTSWILLKMSQLMGQEGTAAKFLRIKCWSESSQCTISSATCMKAMAWKRLTASNLSMSPQLTSNTNKSMLRFTSRYL